jgi:hypothetical protein
MRVCFANYLSVEVTPIEKVIYYRHPFRVNVDVFIEKSADHDARWHMRFRGKNLPLCLKEALCREFRLYVWQRVKKDPRNLSFDDFLEMANAVSVS